ncbi:hypothetical protein BCR35DRAFT_350122 [Leucosporidium creatinivorum]|uniref:Uncharacterized protein n=1 Tax=Leucosporidium creatinivorum TaxID=106004 RepID=A0A1Y2FZN1_9BASI|nr:hypothetical protein BCR35DRAFT_350122 [Leucosporidium creatinivorum]
MASELQLEVARQSVISGTAAVVAGMVYGTQISDTGFGESYLMVAAHVQFMVNGILQILGGLILSQHQLCTMGSTALRIFQAGNVWAPVPVLGVEAWGAKVGVSWPRLIKQAGLPAPDPKLYTFYSILHFGPGGLLLLSWAFLLWACIRGPARSTSAKPKSG